MLRIRFVTLALLAFTALSACDDSSGTGTRANVRLANATNSNLDLATDGTVGTGNSNLAFGASSACTPVNVIEPAVEVRQAGTGNVVTASVLPTLIAGNSYVVVAYPGFSGATQLATISNSVAPTAGQSGLRVANFAAGAGAFDVYVTAPGAALGTASATNIGFGTTSGLINVTAGTSQVRLTNTGTQTVAINAGSLTFVADQTAVLVIAPPAPGTTALRSFLVAGC